MKPGGNGSGECPRCLFPGNDDGKDRAWSISVACGKARVAAPVQRVPEHRCPQVLHVDADLVGASRPRGKEDVPIACRSDGEHPQEPVARDGLPSARHDAGELLAVLRVPGDPRIDDAFLRGKRPRHHGDVALARAALLELAGQHLVRGEVLRHDDDTGGVLVQAVHDARARRVDAEAVRQPAAVMEQRVDQRAGMVAAPRMHHHSLRLVEHDHLLVLEEHAERDVLRNQVRIGGISVRDTDAVPDLQPLGEPGGGAVDLEPQDPGACLAPAEQAETVRQENVEPHPGNCRVFHGGFNGLAADSLIRPMRKSIPAMTTDNARAETASQAVSDAE